MPSDLDIQRQVQLRPITEVAESLGIEPDSLIPYGKFKAKLKTPLAASSRRKDGSKRSKVVLVTATSPTRAGEGKTLSSIGIADTLHRLGRNPVLCLREPSMGPVFGLKGGATGGGRAQVAPMEEINLHFTGDIHAITAANNLIAACLDNHIYWRKEPKLDLDRIFWRRAVDMNDRSLRRVEISRGLRKDTMRYETGFDITVASEVMAIFCLARDREDLRERLANMILAYTVDDEPFRVRDLNIEGSLAVLLDQAFDPNLVQTLEGTPALIHGGPFANIAHGCNSLIATRTAMELGDIVVTEAGFGSDLGAQKFLDLKSPLAGTWPDATVLVTTIRALKYHGGLDDFSGSDPEAVRRGLPNLLRHCAILRRYDLPVVVALNRFAGDTEEEIAVVREAIEAEGLEFACHSFYSNGSAGGIELTEKLLSILDASGETAPEPHYLFRKEETTLEHTQRLLTEIYGGQKVVLSPEAEKDLETIRRLGYEHLPVCMAKTPQSLTEDSKLRGAPTDFDLHIRRFLVRAGAGFVVALAGSIMTMPGLPKEPQAEKIDLVDGQIVNLM